MTYGKKMNILFEPKVDVFTRFPHESHSRGSPIPFLTFPSENVSFPPTHKKDYLQTKYFSGIQINSKCEL